MKKKGFLLAGFMVLVVLLFIYAYMNLDTINEFVEAYVGAYGYIAILILSFLTDIIEQPIGPDAPAAIGVFLSYNPALIIAAALLGSIAGSIVSFNLGRKFLADKVRASDEKYIKHKNFFDKYGKLGLLIAAVTPLPYVLFTWFSGSYGMKFRQYVLYGIAPRMVRISTVVVVLSII